MKGFPKHATSPGGPAVSAAKRKRLAALDNTVKAKQQKLNPAGTGTGTAATLAAPPAAAATVAQPQRQGAPTEITSSGPGEFPYNPLGDAVLDGSLSAALAQAKASAAAAAAESTLPLSSKTVPGGKRTVATKPGFRFGAAPPMKAGAGSAAAGSDSVAADVLAQLIATNPRASNTDVGNLTTQRLQDRSVLLDNPTAALKAKSIFNRRSSSYSAKLRSNVQCKESVAQSEPAAKRTPSYQTMLRVHELWLQYTQNLARSAAAGTGGSAASSSSAQALARLVDLHGARVTVVQHSNPQHVGASGIVLRRNKTCIHLVAPDDRVRVVPLRGCSARYAVNGKTLQLTG